MNVSATMAHSRHDACRRTAGRFRRLATAWMAGLLLASTAYASAAMAQAPTGDPPETLIFESRAAGTPVGGGISVSSMSINGHAFRVAERTRVTRVGSMFHSYAPNTVYMALHRLATPVSAPDAVNESTLVATTLLELPGGGPHEISAPIDATLEPGWYMVAVGTGRHGATTPNLGATVVPLNTPTTPQTYGPYTVRVDTNHLSLQGTSPRYVVYGHVPPPEPAPTTSFLFETVRPSAWWGTGWMDLTEERHIGTRFTLSRPTRVDHVSAWMGVGSGSVFAAILALPNAQAQPPSPRSPAFEAAVVAKALIPVGSASSEYSAAFGEVTLPPGHYALVFGTGRLDATGSGAMMTVADSVVHGDALLYIGAADYWFPDTYRYSMRITGIVPELSVGPAGTDFGVVPLEGAASRTVTITNLRDTGPLAVTGVGLSGDNAAQFEVDPDVAACSEIAAASTCSFTVHYQADAVGVHVANLAVEADSVPSAATVSLTGETVPSAWVTPTVVGNGAIDPETPQLVATGSTVTFSLQPDPGHHIENVASSCGGTLDGPVFTTDPVTADCDVQASFAIDTFTVTASAGPNGTISPVGAHVVPWSGSISFTLTPDAGHHIDGVDSTCGGSLDGNVFTTGPITAECGVHARFAIDTFTVTTSAGANGHVSPAGPQTVAWNQTVSVTLAPDTGYHVDAVTGTCGGTLDGDVFTTVPVTTDCSVVATFALDPATRIDLASGSTQATTVATAFDAPLVARVSNDAGLAVPGVTVAFVTPSEGASATVAASGISDEQGLVSVTATANTISGDYVVVATAAGLAGEAAFALRNVPGAAETLERMSGDDQQVQVNQAFPSALAVRVLDGFGNAVEGAIVRFSAPTSGAGASLLPPVATSDENGLASTTATANATPGSYDVVATMQDASASALFQLQNLAPVLALAVTIDAGVDHVAYGELVEYVVTVRNTGVDVATGTQVLVPLPEQLDAAAAEWHCLDLASGCTAEGVGALSDTMSVLPDSAVRYVLVAPVKPDAAGDWFVIEAFAESTYHEPVDAHDQNWLVLLRDGFDDVATEEDAAASAEVDAFD